MMKIIEGRIKLNPINLFLFEHPLILQVARQKTNNRNVTKFMILGLTDCHRITGRQGKGGNFIVQFFCGNFSI